VDDPKYAWIIALNDLDLAKAVAEKIFRFKHVTAVYAAYLGGQNVPLGPGPAMVGFNGQAVVQVGNYTRWEAAGSLIETLRREYKLNRLETTWTPVGGWAVRGGTADDVGAEADAHTFPQAVCRFALALAQAHDEFCRPKEATSGP
jgi:hypothetical protein